MRKKYIILISCFLLYANFIFSQQLKIVGTVKDDFGEALVGVSVKEKGKSIGTKTDLNGAYSLSVSEPEAILEFTYMGYIKQEVSVGNGELINVILKANEEEMNEVVITGYGTQKKINLSGAVDQVSVKAFAGRSVSNIAQGLQGLVPNLNIDFGSGEPGNSANINIRGITSINGGNPLILIDAVPADPAELNRLASQDVESVSIIKDASAAAIYGARAAFGVILIKTKSGSQKGVNISYTINSSLNKPTIIPKKITDPYIFSRLLELSTNNTPWDNVNYSDQFYRYAKERSDNPSVSGVRINPTDNKLWEYMGNQDWTRYFLNDNTLSHEQSLSINSQSNKMAYYLSGNYNGQNGLLKIADDYFNRYNLRSKVDYKLTSWLTLGNNTRFVGTRREKPTNYSIPGIYNLFPTDYDKNPDGTWSNTEVGRTGARLTQGGKSSDKYFDLQTQFNGDLSFIKDVLKINADFTYRRGTDNYNAYSIPYKIGYGPNDIREEGNNYVSKTLKLEDYTVLNAYATFNKKWEGHDLTILGGYNQEYFRKEINDTRRNGLISVSYPTIGLATGEPTAKQSINDWAIQGLFYRINYMYKYKYIIEFNGRYDGSSRFPSGRRFGFFPSTSLAWRVDQENFMKKIQPLVSNFKLRVSYGSLGNQAVDDYGYISTLDPYASPYLIGGVLPMAVSAPGLVSLNYTWEKVTTANFGTDIGLFNNKLNIAFDIYRRNTKGMLTLSRNLPAVLGVGEPRENAADLRNSGWELSLSYQNSFQAGKNPLSFGARFVLSDSRSVITKFDNPNNSLLRYRNNMELGEIWGLQSDGLFRTQEEIKALDESAVVPWGALPIVPGWPKYKDIDGNGKIETGLTADNPKDLSIIGNFLPRFRFGFDCNVNWKGFDFRAFFQGVAKRDYYPLDYLYWGFYQQPYAGGYEHLLDFYRPDNGSDIDMSKHSKTYINAGLANQNLNARYPILQAWLADVNLGTTPDRAKGLAIPQTGYLLDGAYLRLKNITIGYTLPASLIKKWKLSNVRFYISGENIYEWSALKKYFDPEAINENAEIDPSLNVKRNGNANGYAYPWQRRYSVGFNVNF